MRKLCDQPIADDIPVNRRVSPIKARKGTMKYPRVGTVWRARYTWVERVVVDFSASWVIYSKNGVVCQVRWMTWWQWVARTNAILISEMRQVYEKSGRTDKDRAHPPGYLPF